MNIIRVLLIDDEPAQAWLVQDHLTSAAAKTGKEIKLTVAENLHEGFLRMAENETDILLLDLSLPDSFGSTTFSKVHSQFPDLPTVVFTSLEDEDLGIGLVQAGAQDYLVKGQINDLMLFRTIRHAIERKQAEQALRQSEANYRLLFECGNDAILVYPLENEKPGKFIQANAVACQHLGYTREELLELTPAEINTSECRERFPKITANLLTKNHALFETTHVTKDGHQTQVEVNARLFQIHNRTMVLAMIRDITERKRAETERENLIVELKNALSQVKTLSGLLPICSRCKRIRDDQGYWSRLETYITEHSTAQFSHGLCPDCLKHYLDEHDIETSEPPK